MALSRWGRSAAPGQAPRTIMHPRPLCQSPIEMSLAVPIRDVTRGQGIAFCRPLRSRPWRQAARLSWSGLLGRAAADPSLGRVTFQTGGVVTFLSGVYNHNTHKPLLWNRNQPRFEVFPSALRQISNG